MFNLFNWITTLVESFTFYGGGKGGGGSQPTATDFFGKGARAPYADLLSKLLLGGGNIGGGTTTTSGSDSSSGHWVTTADSFGQSHQSWVPNSGGGRDRGGSTTTTTAGSGGQSISDYIKSTPGYQFGMDQGTQAIDRTSAASGAGPSGAENLSLQNYGNQYAQTQYQQLIQNLMAPSGAGQGGIVTPPQQQSSFGAQALGAYAGAGFPGVSSIFGSGATSAAPAVGSTAFWLGSGGAAAGGYDAMGAAAALLSDIRLKRDIKEFDVINDIKRYTFKYIWSPITYIGVMAQDLLRSDKYKHAVHLNNNGYYSVDYKAIGLTMNKVEG